jgi:hypothetical protein
MRQRQRAFGMEMVGKYEYDKEEQREAVWPSASRHLASVLQGVPHQV